MRDPTERSFNVRRIESALQDSNRRAVPEGVRRRVLIANVPTPRLFELAALLSGLGYDVESSADLPGASLERLPDLVLVGRGEDDGATLDSVRRLSHDDARPVVVLLADPDAAFVRAAAERGAFGYVVGADADAVESMIDVALRRSAQYRGLQGAFERRAVVERAKGILMERQGIGEAEAFVLLREHARHNSRKVVDVALSVIESHSLLNPGDAR
jgi:AmiR/NasT family two-component response regulator